jgi:serine protease Do
MERNLKVTAGMVALAVAASMPVWAQTIGVREFSAMPAALTGQTHEAAGQVRQVGPQQDGTTMMVYPVNEIPGETRGGYLGVGVQDVSDDRLAALKLKDAGGVEIIALDHDGPAAKSGIHEHDVILQMNGQTVIGAEQLRRMLRETPAGRKADFVLSRDGQEVKVQVVLGDKAMVEQAGIPPMPPIPPMHIQLPDMQNLVPAMDVELTGMNSSDLGPMVIMGNGISGAVVESLGPQLAQYFGSKDGVGVLVKEVRRDSAASKSGMRAGDVIVSAGGQPVSGRSVWEHVLWANRGKTVAVQVLREKRTVTVNLHVPERTEGRLVPESFVIDASELPQVAQLSAEEEAKIKQEMEQAQNDMAASRGEREQALAEMKAQMESPEFKQEMEDAAREAEEAAAQVNSPEFKKEMEDAAREAQEAKAQINSGEMKEAIDQVKEAMDQAKIEVESQSEAKAEAKKQTEQMRPEIEKQMKEAQEQMKRAHEEMQRELRPMD